MKFGFYTTIAIFLFLFCIHAFMMFDPDLFWHVRLGQVILTHGLPKTDPFSYTMPGYPMVDYEWLANIFIAKLFPLIGKTGLDIFFAFLLGVALLLRSFFLVQKRLLIGFIPAISTGVSFLSFAATRVQVFTLFFFSLLLTILFDPRWYPRARFLLPIIFLLWANLHGGFAIGIAIYSLTISIKMVKEKKLKWLDVVLCVISIAMTCITPYGTGIWEEVISTTLSSSVHAHLNEWLSPFQVTTVFSFWIFTVFSLVLLWRYKKRFSFVEIVPFVLLLMLALSSVRHIPLFMLYALPLTIQTITMFYQEIAQNTLAQDALKKVVIVLFSLVIIAGTEEAFFVFQQANNLSEKNLCPTSAITYLKTHPPQGNIFADFLWNDCLVLKFPQKKVFLSGMMTQWEWTAPKGESNNALLDYVSIENGNIPFSSMKEKYHITTVVLPVNIHQTPNIVTYLSSNLQPVNLNAEIEKEGMRVVYQDRQAIIYQ